MIEGEPKRKLKKLELSDFSLETTLGSGSYGKVKLARRKKDGAVLCVKSMKKAEIIESKQTDHIINECNIISQISHPMIVTLFLPRSGFRAYPKIRSTCTSLWNMFLEDNCFRI